MKEASLVYYLYLLPVDELVCFTVTFKCTQKPANFFHNYKKGEKKSDLVWSLTQDDDDTLQKQKFVNEQTN